MTSELKFITLDDKTHVVGFSEHTACGLVIPIGESYVFDEPDKLCTQCKKLTEDSDEYGVLKADIEAAAPAPVVDTPPPGLDETAEPEPAPKTTKEATSAKGKA